MGCFSVLWSCGGIAPEGEGSGAARSFVTDGSCGGSGSGGSGGSASGGHSEDVTFCKAQLTRAASHYQGFLAAYTNPWEIPRSAHDGTPQFVEPGDWTSGFPAGSFWLLYEATGESAWRDAAIRWTAALEDQRMRTDTHDVGFIINNTFGAGHRLTGDPAYAGVVREAAESLATRFDPEVGATRSWDFGDWAFPVIIDNMMNLELLFNAVELGGRSELRTMAIAHALTTRANHFRADGSSYHVVDYDPSDGSVIVKQTSQGVHDESAWARGQAWGLYGFTMAFRKTYDQRFLDQAQRIADFYTQSPAMPEDGVPYFDFAAPELSDVPDYRDASAGAIAASALFELADYVDEQARQQYLAFAVKAVRSLSSSSYRAALGTNAHFLLEHSVGHYPLGREIDVAINYADYYYIEALLRCTRLEASAVP
jgi:rhamnogalacturonyl hydrolase YesR